MLGLHSALVAHPIHGAETRDAVLKLAARLMWVDPSHDARSAVAEAVDRITVACVGCGRRYHLAAPDLVDCEVCSEPTCPVCLRYVAGAAVCRRCWVTARMVPSVAHQIGEVVEQKRFCAPGRREAGMAGDVIDAQA